MIWPTVRWHPLELEAEQQDEGAGRADADGQGAVGEAALEELPSPVIVEEGGGDPVTFRLTACAR